MSANIFEAIERILTLGGVAMESGWTLTDAVIPRKLDTARENIEALINTAPLAAPDDSACRWERKDLLRWLKNARKRYNYWNEACRRTGAKAHEMKELYAADIDRLQQLLSRPNV